MHLFDIFDPLLANRAFQLALTCAWKQFQETTNANCLTGPALQKTAPAKIKTTVADKSGLTLNSFHCAQTTIPRSMPFVQWLQGGCNTSHGQNIKMRCQ